MQPSIGRIVHFWPALKRVERVNFERAVDEQGRELPAIVDFHAPDNDGPYAAIITNVCDPVEAGPDVVDLVVFGTSTMSFRELVEPWDGQRMNARPDSACWTWPPRVTGGAP
jgi:hypothetical protein